MFMGTRADLAPNPLLLPVYEWDCKKCQAKTYSVAEPPHDAELICNVCASEMTAQAEREPSTQVMWGMTNQLEDSVRKIADEKTRPTEEVFNRFLEWKLGRPTRANLYNKSAKKEEAK
jgi:hypothetical protein